MTDLSNWLNDDQAAAQLGYSIRTLDRKAERLGARMRPIPGRRPERCWDPGVIQAQMPASPAHVVSTESTALAPIPPHMAAMSQPAPPEITWPAIIALLNEYGAGLQPAEPTIWVRIDDAAQITGLTRTALRRLVKNGAVPAIRDGSIKLRRSDLETIDVSSLEVGR